LGGGDSNAKVIFYFLLSDKITQAPGTQAGIQRGILSAWFS